MLLGVVIGLVLVIVVAGATAASLYSQDIRAARERLDRLESQVVATSHGAIEFAVQGEGRSVLVVHGNAGGFDQGLSLGAESLGDGWRILAPSRFGYLGSPLPPDATPTSQAEAYVGLLDALSVEEVPVIAYSAGGPSAAQMAQRYPERVSALVMVSTAIADKSLGLPPRPVVQTIFGSDYLTWLMTGALRPLMQGMFVPLGYDLSAEEAAVVSETLRSMLPAGPRSEGIVFDIFVTNTDPHLRNEAYKLEDISAPTLIINAQDDPAADFEEAQAMAERIPKSRFLAIEKGGHLMLGSAERVRREITRFLRNLESTTAHR